MPRAGARGKCEILRACGSDEAVSLPAESSMRRGVASGLVAVALWYVAALPSRLAGVLKGWGPLPIRGIKLFIGALLDLAAVAVPMALVAAVVTVLLPLVFKRLRTAKWQARGAIFAALPLGFVLWVITITAQEVKSERGSFPTMFDLLEGGTNASFVEGSVGFLRYERIWLPMLIGAALMAVILLVAFRRPLVAEAGDWRRWAAGVALGLLSGAIAVGGGMTALTHVKNEFTPAYLGDPMTGLVESTVDMLRHKGPATPRELVMDAEFPAGTAEIGAARMGWPAVQKNATHPHRRPLDWSKEPPTRDPRGRKLLDAMARVSRALFDVDDPNVAVFHLSLEGFRADDVNALNPEAPAEIAPFTNSLYAAKSGVLVGHRVFQGGVRTAHCLGAMTCGIGTLPYNLSFIRDLAPFPARCTSDVLSEAGFAHAFFYGSDAKFDDMDHFFHEHGYATLMTQAELPKNLPKGTWEGVTDFALVDATLAHVTEAVKSGPQFALFMSLSNHSPFTPPEDLPTAVKERVDGALKTAPNRADSDDRLRLMTYAYTDEAIARLFAGLERSGLSERSVIMLMADHSTGHAYVWGAEAKETDAAKAQIPFAIVIPEKFRARVKNAGELDAALKAAQVLIDEAPLSQNDVPSLLLALLSAHPNVKSLPEEKRWHTLGGQVTSPYFVPGGEPRSYVLGINGISELFALDRTGARVGDYEDSVFLKTRADRYRVTPRLIPVTATLMETMQSTPR